MVRAILRWVLIIVVLIIIVLWFLGGGIQKIIGHAASFSFSIPGLLNGTSTFGSLGLPFAPEMPQIPTAYGSGEGAQYGDSGQQRTQNGASSPYAGQVAIAQAAARTQTASGQYIEISNAPGTEAVDISGWTLQSALTGALATIPEAASPFIVGRVNTVGASFLQPGGLAYVVSGASPVGVSFSENMCTGYLGTLQPFVPALSLHCAAPLSEIAQTPENVARLGQSCFDYLAHIPPCFFPANPPSTLSAACIGELQNTLSYNGCLAKHQSDANFLQGTWRMYLAQGAPIWGAQHDVVRLLDKQGRVVSVLNY